MTLQHEYSMSKLMKEMRKLIKERNSCTEEEDNVNIGEGLKKKEVRTTFWIFCTVVSFWICWGSIGKLSKYEPFVSFLIFEFLFSVIATLLLIYFKESVSNITMRYAVQTIVAINSCVNPIIYGFHIKRIKNAAKLLYKTLFCGVTLEEIAAAKKSASDSSDPGYLTESSKKMSSTETN